MANYSWGLVLSMFGLLLVSPPQASAIMELDTTPPSVQVSATSGGMDYVEGSWAKSPVDLRFTTDEPAMIYYCIATTDVQCQEIENFSGNNPNPLELSNPNAGTGKVYYYAVDLSGNSSTVQYFRTAVDDTIPSAHIAGPDEGAEISDSVYISLNGEDTYSLIKTACIYSGIDAPSDLIACKDNSEREWYSYDYAPNFIYKWDTTAVSDGSIKLFAVVSDLAGNSVVSQPRNVTVNNYSLGTPGNPAPIRTCSDLQAVGEHLRWHYELQNDIDCSETKGWNGGAGFISIGNGNGFSGQIDGRGYTVSGLVMKSADSRGFFGYLSAGTLKNINFKKVDFLCYSTYCAIIANVNWGTIEQVGLSGRLGCSGKCGGFASQNSGTIARSWAELEIYGIDIGYGGPGYAGLIAGQNYSGRIEDCYAKGKIVVNQGGGLVGLNENSSVLRSYANVEIGDSGYAQNGGLIGWQYQGGSQADSYWNTDISGYANMCGSFAFNGAENCPDANGLTDASIKQTSSFTGWNFENIWAIDPAKNDGYPYLRWQTYFSQADKTAPVISLLGPANVNLYVGDAYADAGAKADDDNDGDISSSLTVNNPVDTSAPAEYYVSYNVKDAAGNAAVEVLRRVRVVARPSAGGGGSNGLVRGLETPKTSFEIFDPVSGTLSTATDEVIVLGVSASFLDLSEAESIVQGGDNRQILLDILSLPANPDGEVVVEKRYAALLASDGLSTSSLRSLKYFVLYGCSNTRHLGAGERAGVLASFLSAYGRLPATLADWEDAIRIARGRWPLMRSSETEARAIESFRKIYLRSPERSDKHDDAALMIMAYGLRPAQRNLYSEGRAFVVFKSIFGRLPSQASDWDVVRAIAYSGASR